MTTVFKNDTEELNGKDFYYSRRFARGAFNVIKPHSHMHYEIYFLTGGNRKYFIQNKIYTVNTGDIILIAPNVIHYTSQASSDTHERILLNFTEEYVSPQIKDKLSQLCALTCLTLSEEGRRELGEIYARIASEYSITDKYSALMQRELLTELLITILRTGEQRESPSPSASAAKADLDRVFDYIAEELSHRITLDSAAARAGFSKSHFAKLFKESTGFTFNSYLQLQRLQRAKYLLEKTNNGISEIAYECGFMSSGYFATVFKNYFGLSPHSYRSHI